MRNLFLINSIGLFLLVALNEVFHTSILPDWITSFDQQFAHTFMQTFPFGHLPVIFGIISLALPVWILLRKNKKGTQLSAASLLVMNPLLVYNICNIGYNQFALAFFHCGI